MLTLAIHLLLGLAQAKSFVPNKIRVLSASLKESVGFDGKAVPKSRKIAKQGNLEKCLFSKRGCRENICGIDFTGINDLRCHVSAIRLYATGAEEGSPLSDILKFSDYAGLLTEELGGSNGLCSAYKATACRRESQLLGTCTYSGGRCQPRLSSFGIPGLVDKYGCEDGLLNDVLACWKSFESTGQCGGSCEVKDVKKGAIQSLVNMVEYVVPEGSSADAFLCMPKEADVAALDALVENSVYFGYNPFTGGATIEYVKYRPEFLEFFGTCENRVILPALMRSDLLTLLEVDQSDLGRDDALCRDASPAPYLLSPSACTAAVDSQFTYNFEDFTVDANPFLTPIASKK